MSSVETPDRLAEHYLEGIRFERDRVLRIIMGELRTHSNIGFKNGTENTREHAAVMVKLGLLYEMVKD